MTAILAPTDPDSWTAAPPRVLIVDDDEELGGHVAGYLRGQGFVAETACDAPRMDRALAFGDFDVVVLDVMMAGEDGLSICRRLAGAPPAVVMLSAMGDEVDRIVALELGADDYLVKPCNPRELLARIRAVLRRRAAPQPAVSVRGLCYRFGGYELEIPRRLLRSAGRAAILLTHSEIAMMLVFLDHAGDVLTRDELMEFTRQDGEETFERSVDVQVSRLRRKLGDSDLQHIIRTVRGVGYKFAIPVERA